MSFYVGDRLVCKFGWNYTHGIRVHLMGESVNIVKINTEAVSFSGKEVDL